MTAHDATAADLAAARTATARLAGIELLAHADFIPTTRAQAVAQWVWVAWTYRRHYTRRGSIGRNMARRAIARGRAVKAAEDWRAETLS